MFGIIAETIILLQIGDGFRICDNLEIFESLPPTEKDKDHCASVADVAIFIR